MSTQNQNNQNNPNPIQKYDKNKIEQKKEIITHEGELIEIDQEVIDSDLFYQEEDDIKLSLKRARLMIMYLGEIRKLSIQGTNSNDWMNQRGKPYLTISGSNKIAMNFGIHIYNVKIEELLKTDSKGAYIQYKCTGTAKWNQVEREDMGLASTNDDFFCKRYSQDGNKTPIFLNLEQVDKNTVQKTAHTNFMNRVIKNLLGLSFTWEEIEKFSNDEITQKGVIEVGKHGKKPEYKQDTLKLKQQMIEWLKKIFATPNGLYDGNKICTYLVEISTFEVAGKKIPGKSKLDNFSEKQIIHHHTTIKRKYDEFMQSQQFNNRGFNKTTYNKSQSRYLPENQGI